MCLNLYSLQFQFSSLILLLSKNDMTKYPQQSRPNTFQIAHIPINKMMSSNFVSPNFQPHNHSQMIINYPPRLY